MQRDTSHESAPDPGQPAPNSDSSFASADNLLQDHTPPRRNGVNTACEACQKSKTECSGDQPRCLSCAQQDTNCQYASAEMETEVLMRKLLEERKKGLEYQYFFNAVKNMPEEESQAVYRLIRQRADIKTVVRQIKEGNLS
ncbi:hypothetical protein ACSS6W_002176 [Trichoderma asperelloides]|nr:hypothetical protein LI328DRAFT_135954 [Trichoderma asperelloides]